MAGKLIDIFQNCKCVKEEKHLAAGEVRSLAFGDNNTVMVVELGLHEVVSRKVIARVEKQIADTYGLDRVMIEPRYNMPGELSNEYIKSLYDDMAYRMPSAKGLLDHTKVGVRGRCAPDTDGRGERKAFRKRTAASGGAYSAGAGEKLSGARGPRGCTGFCTRTRAGGEPRGNSAQGCGASGGSRSGNAQAEKAASRRRSSTPAISARAPKRCARTTLSSAS